MRGAALGAGLLLAAAFAGVAMLVYEPCLEGPFYSDDVYYIAQNPWIRELSGPRLVEILTPGAEPARQVHNYAPVQVLLHAGQWRVFGDRVEGYHVGNVLLHALVALLLVAVFRDAGIAGAAAVAAAAFFLVHPANVEAVAWISQLKTTASMALVLVALLLFERRPLLSAPVFALALLTKATVAFALPVAAVRIFVGGDAAPREAAAVARRAQRQLPTLVLWAALFALFAAVELPAFSRANAPVEPMHPDAAVQARSIVAVAGRYLVMAATSLGVAAFQEPGPARSLLDPWWLLGLAGLLGLGARTVWALARRRREAVFWVWAAAAWLPVSQWFPFEYPLADRYLYTILPGLLGGTLLALAPVAHRLSIRLPAARPLAAAAAAALVVVLATRSHARAALWAHPPRLVADAAARYPDGLNALFVAAQRAAGAGDAAGTAAALREALARGFDRFEQVQRNPAYAPVRDTPEMRAVVREMAASWITKIGALESPSQPDLWALALAHEVRGERAEARRALEQAAAQTGPLDDLVRRELRRRRAPDE